MCPPRHSQMGWTSVPELEKLKQEPETFVTPFEGFRMWNLKHNRLWSVGMDDIDWPKYEKIEAHCHCGSTGSWEQCKAGIYAYNSFKALVDDNYYDLSFTHYSDICPLIV